MMVKKTDAFRPTRMSKLELAYKQGNEESDLSWQATVTESVNFLGTGRGTLTGTRPPVLRTGYNVHRINVLQHF
jgi:hypothetical protein